MIYSCKDCTNRKPKCHTTCEKYIREKQEYEQTKRSKQDDRDIKRYLQASIGANVKQEIKKNRRRFSCSETRYRYFGV